MYFLIKVKKIVPNNNKNKILLIRAQVINLDQTQYGWLKNVMFQSHVLTKIVFSFRFEGTTSTQKRWSLVALIPQMPDQRPLRFVLSATVGAQVASLYQSQP